MRRRKQDASIIRVRVSWSPNLNESLLDKNFRGHPIRELIDDSEMIRRRIYYESSCSQTFRRF